MTREQALLSGLAKVAFRLNGQFLAVGEELARTVGLTASWWLVLGTVLEGPRSVAQIAREVGVTRQSVQRTSDVLVDRGLAEYQPNPAHRRAKLVVPTEFGRAAVRRIGPAHRAFAYRLARDVGADELERALAVLSRLSDVLDRVGQPSEDPTAARIGP